MLSHKNPFAIQRVEQLLAFNPSIAGTSWQTIEQQWHAFNCRASIIGPHGSGKTTLLDAFQTRLENTQKSILRISLNRSNRQIAPTIMQALHHCSEKIIFLDGEEQLSFLKKRRFYQLTQTAKGLLVTRHTRGKLPTLHTCTVTQETLDHCVRTLSPQHYSILQPHLPLWWKQEKGNIRHILLHCYDFLGAL